MRFYFLLKFVGFLVFCFIPILSISLYVEIKDASKTYSVQKSPTGDPLTHYKELVDFLRQTSDPEFQHYHQVMKDLNQLPCRATGALIGHNWYIGATHVLQTTEMGHPYEHNGHLFMVDKLYYHPSLDLALAHSPNLFGIKANIEPVRCYLGKNIQSDQYYAFSDALHNKDGNLYKDFLVDEGLLGVIGQCKLENNILNQTLTLRFFSPSGSITVTTHGGDSSGPVFRKVNSTGDPHKDYAYVGVNGPGGENVQAVYTGHPETQNWVSNIIIAEAIEKDQPTREFPEIALVVVPQSLKEKYLLIPRTLGIPINQSEGNPMPRLIDSCWVIGTTKMLNKTPLIIKEELNEAGTRTYRKETVNLAKVILPSTALYNFGLTLAKLEKPVTHLKSNVRLRSTPITPFNNWIDNMIIKEALSD